jgi:hypothetical protein
MEKVIIDAKTNPDLYYNPDPKILKKKGQSRDISDRYELYKRKISDPKYLNYAIDKLALELTHFLWT